LARWQDVQFKELFETMPNESIILCTNFFENYTMKVQNEIQNMHWHNFQVSILVQIAYKKNPSFESSGDEPKVIKEVHYYVGVSKIK
jgi:hypothetical protein